MQHREVAQVHWDVTKLLELGVDEQFVNELSSKAIRELLKRILYLIERRQQHE